MSSSALIRQIARQALLSEDINSSRPSMRAPSQGSESEPLGLRYGPGSLNYDPFDPENTPEHRQMHRVHQGYEGGGSKNDENIRYIVVHHSASMPNNKDGTPKSKDQILTKMRASHMKEGMSGIAYNKLILPDGDIVITRPDNIAPGSQMNYNKGTVSVCLVGYFHENKDKLRSIQLSALDRVLGEWRKKYPNATIVGHRQIGDTATECPGDDLFSHLKQKYPDVTSVGSKRIRRTS